MNYNDQHLVRRQLRMRVVENMRTFIFTEADNGTWLQVYCILICTALESGC